MSIEIDNKIIQYLKTLQEITWNLNEENIIESIESITNLIDTNYPLSFNLLLSNLLYFSFSHTMNNYEIYFNFLKLFEQKGGIKIIEAFTKFLLLVWENESFYLLEKMLEQNFIDSKIVGNSILMRSLYFAHRLSDTDINKLKCSEFSNKFFRKINELKEDNWKLHKEYVYNGINPNEIAQIIRNDKIEKLQDLTSQQNFAFNQRIEPSLYERCSFINQNNVTLIDYAAFFGAINCFKFLMLNGSNMKNTGKYAVAGGNVEIFHLCEQNNSSFDGSYEAAIEFHRNKIFHYLYENQIAELNLIELGEKCVLYHNYKVLSFLEKEKFKISYSIMNKSARIGNLYLIKYFLEGNKPPKDILVSATKSENIELVKFVLEQNGIDIDAKDNSGDTALIFASEVGNKEIVKLLLDQNGIDINAKNKWGETALMKASRNGKTEIVKLLLEQEEIEVNAEDRIIKK